MKFVFIGGSGRSGTTLLQKMLLVHSQITGGPEFDYLYPLLTTYRDMILPYQLDRQSYFYTEAELKETWKNFIDLLLTKHIDTSKYAYMSEKTPTDILVSTELLDMFPDCKVIYMYRDGRDVVNSFSQVSKRAKEQNEKVHGKLTDFAVLWNNCSKKFTELKNNPNYSNRVHAVRYEDIVASPDKIVADVMSFLELSIEEKQVTPDHEGSKQLNVVDNVWYTKNMYTQNIGKQNIQKWRQELSLYQRIVIQLIMARQLKEYNYPVSGFYLGLNALLRNIKSNVRRAK